MYQTEHDVLFSSIRAGKPFNDGEKQHIAQWLLSWEEWLPILGKDTINRH